MSKAINIITCSFFILILSGCAPWIGCVTPDVNGLVIDKDSGDPIARASIKIKEHPTLSATSDENGKFFIKNKKDLILILFIGDRFTFNTLNVEKTGYISQSVDLFGWPPCGPIDITVELEPLEGAKTSDSSPINGW